MPTARQRLRHENFACQDLLLPPCYMVLVAEVLLRFNAPNLRVKNSWQTTFSWQVHRDGTAVPGFQQDSAIVVHACLLDATRLAADASRPQGPRMTRCSIGVGGANLQVQAASSLGTTKQGSDTSLLQGASIEEHEDLKAQVRRVQAWLHQRGQCLRFRYPSLVMTLCDTCMTHSVCPANMRYLQGGEIVVHFTRVQFRFYIICCRCGGLYVACTVSIHYDVYVSVFCMYAWVPIISVDQVIHNISIWVCVYSQCWSWCLRICLLIFWFAYHLYLKVK